MNYNDTIKYSCRQAKRQLAGPPLIRQGICPAVSVWQRQARSPRLGPDAGAAVGLMLALRRQHHQEIATALTDRDATERRITELYTRAVEQLGNDKAPVRLGGLYALERLAQDNPAQRQAIVNVVWSYRAAHPR